MHPIYLFIIHKQSVEAYLAFSWPFKIVTVYLCANQIGQKLFIIQISKFGHMEMARKEMDAGDVLLYAVEEQIMETAIYWRANTLL